MKVCAVDFLTKIMYTIEYINKLVGKHEISELVAIIIHTGIKRLRNRIENTNIALSFLDKEFAISELQQVYEIILDKKLVSANFRKKVELYSSMGYRNCYQFRTLHYAAKSVRTHSG